MKIDQSYRYIVPMSDLNNLEARLSSLNADCVVKDKFMKRILFDFKNKNGHNWVRVRIGDVKLNGDTFCAITYKKISKLGTTEEKNVIEVEVGDFHETVELLEQIGLNRKSTQESKRTKYVFNYENDEFELNIDEWPGLSSLRFLSIKSLNMVNPQSLEDACESLHLEDYDIYTSLDSIFKKYHGKTMSDTPLISFSLQLD